MKRWERWTFNISAAVTAITGLAYFWMKYLLVTDDPFALVNHPWQATTLHLHVLVAPLFTLIFGIVLNSHVLKKLKAFRGPNRTSGLASLVLFAAMLASGYLLQVVSSDAALKALVVVHTGSGVAFALAYAAHLVGSVRWTRRKPAFERARDVA